MNLYPPSVCLVPIMRSVIIPTRVGLNFPAGYVVSWATEQQLIDKVLDWITTTSAFWITQIGKAPNFQLYVNHSGYSLTDLQTDGPGDACGEGWFTVGALQHATLDLLSEELGWTPPTGPKTNVRDVYIVLGGGGTSGGGWQDVNVKDPCGNVFSLHATNGADDKNAGAALFGDYQLFYELNGNHVGGGGTAKPCFTAIGDMAFTHELLNCYGLVDGTLSCAGVNWPYIYGTGPQTVGQHTTWDASFRTFVLNTSGVGFLV